ncbi:hypothetical protein BJ170DRAFT_590162 [Xylariales sp. AK1849]|nr:hypothetical protein BJ170DRAFT_590162 [Xylariales sp. AK1849]
MARHLFALLYNTPIDVRGILVPNHNYGGAAIFHNPSTQGPVAQIYNSEYFYIHHDPADEFDFDFDLPLAPTAEMTQIIRALTISDSGDENRIDAFRHLPSEIVFMILEHLPSKSVCSFRLASRYVAVMSRTEFLPQSFWCSRFGLNCEMGFVFAMRELCLPSEPIDWRQLYIKAKTMLKKSRAYPGYQNRHRIWQTLDHIIPALLLRLENEIWLADAPYNGRNPRLDGFTSRGIVAGELTYEHGSSTLRSNSSATTELDAGCRLFEIQRLYWPKFTNTESVGLGVSFVYHDEKTYISGLRLLSAWNSFEKVEYTRAGLINASDERVIVLNQNGTLEALEVNVVMEGILGLRFDTRGPSGVHSTSAGNLDVIDAGNGTGKLGSKRQLRQLCFIVGIDACKLVSLQLLEEPLDTASKDKAEDQSTQDLQSVDVWNPNTPNHCPAWHSPVASPSQTFNMCLDIDFGNSDGKLLATLSTINVFMGRFPAVFYGMSFVYSDGSEKMYGRKIHRNVDIRRDARHINCIVQSFSLAGDKGELVNRVKTSYATAHDTIQAISIFTTFERSVCFRLHGVGSYIEDASTTTTMASGPGEVLSAFCVRLKSPGGHIRDFSKRTIADNSASNPTGGKYDQKGLCPLTLERPFLSSAEEMLAYNGGYAFAVGSLVGVRAIHLSTGRSGFSRESQHISGLRLDYEGSDSPIILGQWIAEFASLELAPDERLTEITTWHDFTNRFSRVKFGPTVGMKFATSKGAVRKFLRQQVEGKVCLKYRENRNEDLLGILWGCNYQWDHVRVLYTPKPTKRRKGLLYGAVTRPVPGWAVREKVFLEDAHPDGSLDAISAVEVTFKHLSSEPSGLSFLYQSGKVQTIGYRGEKVLSETVQENEKLTRLDIGVLKGDRLGSITFQTDKNRTLAFTHEADRARTINETRSAEFHLLQPSLEMKAPDMPKYSSCFEVPESAGDFVGMWAISRRQDGSLKYPLFGPIFESKTADD